MYAVIIRLARLFAWLFYRHRVYGREHLKDGAFIIAPNHVSYLDPPLTAVSSPKKVYFLARKTLFKGLFGKLIYLLGSRPVSSDTANAQVFKEIEALLKRGERIIIFPEGTRSETGEFNEVKAGIFLLFQRTHCGIQPTYLFGTNKVWGKEARRPKLFGRTGCVFGSPILWERYADLEKKEASVQFAKDLKTAILALQKWHQRGCHGIPP